MTDKLGFNGYGVTDDLVNGARNGDLLSQFALAAAVLDGQSKIVDSDEAFRLLRNSAEKGFAPAMFYIAAWQFLRASCAVDWQSYDLWLGRAVTCGYAPALWFQCEQRRLEIDDEQLMQLSDSGRPHFWKAPYIITQIAEADAANSVLESMLTDTSAEGAPALTFNGEDEVRRRRTHVAGLRRLIDECRNRAARSLSWHRAALTRSRYLMDLLRVNSVPFVACWQYWELYHGYCATRGYDTAVNTVSAGPYTSPIQAFGDAVAALNDGTDTVIRERAVASLTRAAKGGFPPAMLLLVACIRPVDGRADWDEEPNHWLDRAAERGHVPAIAILGQKRLGLSAICDILNLEHGEDEVRMKMANLQSELDRAVSKKAMLEARLPACGSLSIDPRFSEMETCLAEHNTTVGTLQWDRAECARMSSEYMAMFSASRRYCEYLECLLQRNGIPFAAIEAEEPRGLVR